MAGLADVGLELHKKTTIRLTQPEAKELTDTFFKALKSVIIADGKVTVKGFGTFVYKHCPACIKRNPATGGEVNVPAKNVIRFKPAKAAPPAKPVAKTFGSAVKKSNRK